MRDWTSLRVPARARFAAEVTSVEQLDQLLSDRRLDRLPVLPLGEGTNVLFAGDYPGLVLRIRIRGWQQSEQEPDRVALTVGAGESWPQLVRTAVGRSWYGVENLTDIPGSVGAAPVQNIGAYGSELAEVVERVATYDLTSGARAALMGHECQFSYRSSVFKTAATGQTLITAVTLRLSRALGAASLRLDYPGVADELRAIGAAAPPSLIEVSEAIARLRRRKLPDPARQPNAGSFFKNPIVPWAEFAALRDAYGAPGWPHAPAAPTDTPVYVKLSAAWLIEQCGLRGTSFGHVRVSQQHALVLINEGCRSGAELLAAADTVSAMVAERFGITLEREVRVVATAGEMLGAAAASLT